MIKMKAKKAKSGIFKIIFSRTALVAALLLFQIGLMIATITSIEKYAFSVYVSFIVLSMIVIIYIINRKENPAFKMSWILFVTFIPIVGTVFYIFMQIQPGTRYIGKRLFELGEKTKPYMFQNDKIIEDLRISKPANANLAHYLSKQVGFPVHRNTKVTYFRVGEEKFEELKRQLESAKHFIFMEYFIVEEGIMWDSILEILKRKVDEGVEVRFMYDGMCRHSSSSLSVSEKT